MKEYMITLHKCVQKSYIKKYTNTFHRMTTTYYVVLEDLDYDKNHIRFISQVEGTAIQWYLDNKDSKKQYSIIKYNISEKEGIVSETEILTPYNTLKLHS